MVDGDEIGTGIAGAADGIRGFYLRNVLGMMRTSSGAHAGRSITSRTSALTAAMYVELPDRVRPDMFLQRGGMSFAIGEG